MAGGVDPISEEENPRSSSSSRRGYVRSGRPAYPDSVIPEDPGRICICFPRALAVAVAVADDPSIRRTHGIMQSAWHHCPTDPAGRARAGGGSSRPPSARTRTRTRTTTTGREKKWNRRARVVDGIAGAAEPGGARGWEHGLERGKSRAAAAAASRRFMHACMHARMYNE